MDWFNTLFKYYNSGYYTPEELKIFVSKGKITADQYKQITDIDYVA